MFKFFFFLSKIVIRNWAFKINMFSFVYTGGMRFFLKVVLFGLNVDYDVFHVSFFCVHRHRHI